MGKGSVKGRGDGSLRQPGSLSNILRKLLFTLPGMRQVGLQERPRATPLKSSAGTAPAPSTAACPVRWRWPGTRPAEAWPSPCLLARSAGAGRRRSRSRSRPARAGVRTCGRKQGSPRNGLLPSPGCPWFVIEGPVAGRRPSVQEITWCPYGRSMTCIALSRPLRHSASPQ